MANIASFYVDIASLGEVGWIITSNVRAQMRESARNELLRGTYYSRRVVDTHASQSYGNVRLADVLRSYAVWTESFGAALLHEYEGHYIAVVDFAVVDHDTDLFVLSERTRERFASAPVLIRYVSREAMDTRFSDSLMSGLR